MTIGTVELADGRQVKGFLVEPYAVEGTPDITRFGGWRAYLGIRVTADGAAGTRAPATVGCPPSG
ncbi:hypothetical protein SCANM63S_00083 [Streptomyces canarius]